MNEELIRRAIRLAFGRKRFVDEVSDAGQFIAVVFSRRAEIGHMGQLAAAVMGNLAQSHDLVTFEVVFRTRADEHMLLFRKRAVVD